VVAEIGVRSAFALPIFSSGELVAVLEFFSDKIITKDNSLLNVIAHVGSQLGHVYDRVHAEKRITLLNQTLEDRILERTKELKAKNEELALQQQAVVSSSKMSALGEMASGVAHEINNPLAIIQVRAEQLKEIAETEEIDNTIVIDVVDEIIKTATRIATIVKGLRSFARDGRNDPFQLAVLKTIIEETVDLCKEKFKHNNIHLDIKPISVSMEIECRATQISQVILNLLNNAYDAIQQSEEKWVCVAVSDLGHQIEISIMDSGKGIPKELQDKIMQPFFTTKEIGRGTGLGLSISRGIILSHRGQLIIDNASKNTHFIIQLPKAQSSYERKVS
jgi:C4-dicarboxylate-specific signal transduction histidine kinase